MEFVAVPTEVSNKLEPGCRMIYPSSAGWESEDDHVLWSSILPQPYTTQPTEGPNKLRKDSSLTKACPYLGLGVYGLG